METAVEWLFKLSKERELDKFDLQQAKQMEREQIIDCLRYAIQQEYYNHTWANCQSTSIAAEMYYNNIFK